MSASSHWSAKARSVEAKEDRAHNVRVDKCAFVVALELLAADAAVGRATLGRKRVAFVLSLKNVLNGRERARGRG